MAFPRHVECLMQTRIDREVSRLTQGIAISAFTRLRITVALENRRGIREQVWIAIHVAEMRFNRPNRNHAG